MIKVSIPYKAHTNKLMWDYMAQVCSQLNNINLAKNLSAPEADIDNILYVVFNPKDDSITMLVSLSQYVDEEHYQPFVDVWCPMESVVVTKDDKEDDTTDLDKLYVFSFDIKKYNSMLSFAEEYQSRDRIKFYIDTITNKLYYKISNNNFIDISPITLSQESRQYILSSYEDFQHKSNLSSEFYDRVLYLDVTSVDKNSFLMPFMSYKDFLNFAVYSAKNRSAISTYDDVNYFENNLTTPDGELKFYSRSVLRKDKFDVRRTNSSVPVGLWQVLVILQQYKFWQHLYAFGNNTAILTFNPDDMGSFRIVHLFKAPVLYTESVVPDLSNFKLVGKMHSNEMFRLNKLYSNANRTCYFDFSTQTFTGNNYVFNDNKLEPKTVNLECCGELDAELPLKITMTEIKHYVGSDLSQKNFMLYVYTDGIRVMLERWDGNSTAMECRVVFNHTMSRTNQKLTI